MLSLKVMQLKPKEKEKEKEKKHMILSMMKQKLNFQLLVVNLEFKLYIDVEYHLSDKIN